MAPSYQASPKVAIQWNDDDQLVTVKIKLLRNGCLGMAQFLASTQTEAVFGFAEAGYLDKTPEALLRVDDCMAFVLYDEERRRLKTRVCVEGNGDLRLHTSSQTLSQTT